MWNILLAHFTQSWRCAPILVIKLGIQTFSLSEFPNFPIPIHPTYKILKPTKPQDFNPDRPNRRIYSFQELNLTSLYATQEYMCLSDTAISLLGYPNGLKPDRPPKVQVKRHYCYVWNCWQWSEMTEYGIILYKWPVEEGKTVYKMGTPNHLFFRLRYSTSHRSTSLITGRLMSWTEQWSTIIIP